MLNPSCADRACRSRLNSKVNLQVRARRSESVIILCSRGTLAQTSEVNNILANIETFSKIAMLRVSKSLGDEISEREESLTT